MITAERIKRELPVYSAAEEPLFRFELPSKTKLSDRLELFKKRYAWLLVAAALFCLYTIILSSCVRVSTEKAVTARLEAEYAARLDAWKAEQAYQAQAEHWLSGDASREAFIDQQITVAAKAAGANEMKTDVQKGGVIYTMLARVMSSAYPDTFQAVADQEGQIPFYKADNKYSQHDWDLAESILRPYYESGIIPNGLTDKYVYAEWSENDYVLRDAWLKDSNANYLRYSG
jgi:hypothetical protein